jgi:16S rRNA (cytosine1402-N4)-methyltransferase
VLLESSVNGLAIDSKKRQVFVDLTFGGGGHSERILELMGSDSILFAFDQDVDATANRIKDDRLIMVESNFRYFRKFLRVFEIMSVDGILADLGVSSYQIDESSRGFSYRTDQMLDMRMNQELDTTAADILNTFSEEELVKMFSEYGELRNSKQLAKKIVNIRQRLVFSNSEGLIQNIEGIILGNRTRYLSQLFQALRIEVNDEINALREMLNEVANVLKPGGRLSTISYHSLEDRLVKNLIKTGSTAGIVEKDFFGNRVAYFKEIIKGPITPDDEELNKNSRSRSARLRIAERL